MRDSNRDRDRDRVRGEDREDYDRRRIGTSQGARSYDNRDTRRTSNYMKEDHKRGRSKSPEYSNQKATEPTQNPSTSSSTYIVPHEETTEDNEDAQLASLFGISGFASTKGQKVKGNEFNAAADVKKGKKKREYRQYLYVKGSYDIPLTKDQLQTKEDRSTEPR